MENKILVTQPSMPELSEYIEVISKIWDTHWLTNMGPIHNQLMEELTSYLSVPYIELLTNGHMALELSMQAMNLRGEVITSPFTFASTTHAIVRNGLEPVFCDINEDDYTIDVSKIESLITDRTSAIVPIHVYGNICDIEEIDRLAHKYNLKVIYDAAHTFGVKYKGRGIGSFGDASCFSFHATKVFNTIEGGAVCFSDESFGRELYKLKDFGIKTAEIIDGIGANAKMNEFCAAMGICNLKHIDMEIEKRGKVVQRYRENLYGIEGIKLSPIQKNVDSNYAYFPIVIDERSFGSTRQEIQDELQKHNIFTRKYFFPITNMMDCYKGRFDPDKTPIARKVSLRVLTLPLYSDLSLNDVDRICNIILSKRRNN